MNRPRHQLLAGPGFAQNQDIGICAGYLLGAFALADKVGYLSFPLC
jgi:hypothetical protein